jgi:hypothetical protein
MYSFNRYSHNRYSIKHYSGKSAAALLLCAALGCSDNKPAPLTASVSAVEPALVFLGRTRDVEISGFATNWSDTTTVDFGANIKVNKVTAASPTAIVANITIDTKAQVGARDVTVTDGMTMETFKGAFTVDAPLKATASGTVAQGSLSVVRVENLDHDNFFDTTTSGGGLLGPPTYPNIAFTLPTGVQAAPASVSPTSLDFTLIVDVTAAAATLDLDVASGPPNGDVLHFVLPGGLKIAARTATPLTGTPVTGNIMTAFDSNLYQVTPAAGLHVQSIALTTTNQMAQPTLVLMPKSGSFNDVINNAASLVFSTNAVDPFYAVLWESAGTAPYDFAIQRTESAVTGATEAEPNNTTGAATAVATLPALITNGNLDASTDVDFYSLTVAQGKKIHVTTLAGDAAAAQAIDIVDSTAANTSVLPAPGGPVDTGSFVDATSDPVAKAGTYYIKVSASAQQFVFDPTMAHYQLWVRLE